MGTPEVDRLLETATRLFAEIGYDGTSLQLVADAAGVDVAAVREFGDGKAGLYRAVMTRADRVEQAAMEPALAAFTPDVQGVQRLMDAYIDFYVANTDVLALWQHRWMGDAADVPGLEQCYTVPLAVQASKAIGRVVPDDVDPDHLVWTVVWCVYGFLTGGMVYTDRDLESQDPRGPGRGPRRRADVERFRAHMHTLVVRFLAPPPQPMR